MRFTLLCIVVAFSSLAAAQEVAEPYFGIRVIDAATGRGIPLVELRTVNEIVLQTDSLGWAAFHEPEMMNREVYFTLSSAGYEFPADGFGYRGTRLTTTPGKSATLKLKRLNLAERMYRVTGAGIYREGDLLKTTPENAPRANVLTLGQDSVQVVKYRDRLFWLWGDTNLANYPLGNFHTTAATSPLPGPQFHPELGVPLEYFVESKQPQRVRAMAPNPEPGPVWLFGLLNVTNAEGKETLLAHYSRQKNLAEVLEQGLVQFEDEKGVFQKVALRERTEKWRFPTGNAVRVKQDGKDYFYFTSAFAQVRVPADWESLLDPKRYEALTYDADAKAYRWQHELPPTTQAEERKLLAAGKMEAKAARYQVIDVLTQEPVRDLHRSSIEWNSYRQCWILIGVQQAFSAAPSHLGEVWYAEADNPAGPWRKAIKIASHPNYTFYNPRQHPFMNDEEGRMLYFEGTYTHTFSGNPVATPRYDYNQLMYRLDLADERLQALR